jgi:hypothetical protein
MADPTRAGSRGIVVWLILACLRDGPGLVLGLRRLRGAAAPADRPLVEQVSLWWRDRLPVLV